MGAFGSATPERRLARIVRADIADVYNGMLGLVVEFAYDKSSRQGLGGYMLDAAFVIRFMGAIGVDRLSAAVGKSCWVTATHDKVLSVEPLHEEDGRPFVISEWQEWAKRRLPPMCWDELATGRETRSR